MNYGFHRAAIAEHLDQVAFYESQLAGLGADYLGEFDAVMARICADPNRFALAASPDIRKVPLKRFPFHVIYRVEANRIVVLAVAHQRRLPSYWEVRISR
jgi:hypothetical protein